MRIWATVWKDNQRVQDVIIDTAFKKARDISDWEPLIGEAAQSLKLSRPVILKKHISELTNFGRAVFRWDDFIESVDFDRFVVELISDKSK